MSTDSKFSAVTQFSDGERVSANKEILERVTRVLFSTFMDDGPMSDDEVDELLDDSFEISGLIMAVCGMNVVGKNQDGDYVVEFSPYSSLDSFMKERGML